MSALAARCMHWTEAEYTAFENRSAGKHEYLAGEVFAMAGAKPTRNRVATSVAGSLVALLREGRCAAFNGDQRIYIPATGLYTYADGGVACGEWQIHTDEMCLLNPVLLLEVLSPSTRDYDLGAKRQHYQQIVSLRHLLFFDQPERQVWHDQRLPDGLWETAAYSTGSVDLAGLGGAISVDEIYAAALSAQPANS